jgi:hypothetical protein
MPKNDIDYSNTIIYKITCKNPTVTDVYVGHTTNFVQRKHAHKQSCLNHKSPNHNCKLYEVIRLNGGWFNWKMDIINFFNCADHYSARKKEQEYFVSLNATLNSIEPLPKPKNINKEISITNPKILYCNTCNIKCVNSKTFDIHNKSIKHIKNEEMSNLNENNTKNKKTYNCETCNLDTNNKKDYSKHLLTRKHIKNTESDKNIQRTHQLTCECGKIYKHYSGLWRHKKICKNKNINKSEIITLIKDNNDIKELIKEVVKNNNELQKQNKEYQKQMTELYNKSNNMVISSLI